MTRLVSRCRTLMEITTVTPWRCFATSFDRGNKRCAIESAGIVLVRSEACLPKSPVKGTGKGDSLSVQKSLRRNNYKFRLVPGIGSSV
jgi:hypothetical protein